MGKDQACFTSFSLLCYCAEARRDAISCARAVLRGTPGETPSLPQTQGGAFPQKQESLLGVRTTRSGMAPPRMASSWPGLPVAITSVQRAPHEAPCTRTSCGNSEMARMMRSAVRPCLISGWRWRRTRRTRDRPRLPAGEEGGGRVSRDAVRDLARGDVGGEGVCGREGPRTEEGARVPLHVGALRVVLHGLEGGLGALE